MNNVNEDFQFSFTMLFSLSFAYKKSTDRDNLDGSCYVAEIDDCRDVQCLNDAQCSDGENAFQCLCRAGFTGDFCETGRQHELRCHQLTRMRARGSLLLGEAVDVPVYSLDQIARATLTRCRSATYCIGVVDIDDCSSALCLNGATCIDGVASYTCICPPGKSGIACEIGNA